MTCPYIGDLYFGFGEAANGTTVLIPLTAHNDRTVTRFIDGTELRQCDFALARFGRVNALPNDTVNIDAQITVESIAKWIDAQGVAGNFPVFASSRHIHDLYTLPVENGFMSAHGDATAKFMLQFRIEYYCEE